MDRVEVLTCSIEDYMSKRDSLPINKVQYGLQAEKFLGEHAWKYFATLILFLAARTL